MYIYTLQISKECVVGELGGRCDESQYVCICYFHSITPNKLNESKLLLIEMKRRSLTTIDVADRHKVDALFIAETYKKRRISEACSLATELSTRQTNPTLGGEGHLLLLLSRHPSQSYLLLYASLLLQMSWGSGLVIDRLWFVLHSIYGYRRQHPKILVFDAS